LLTLLNGSVLHMQIHQLIRHHVLVQIGHDPERADNHQGDDEYAKRKRQDIVAVIRPRSDQEEH
jgi:hypothetical protein